MNAAHRYSTKTEALRDCDRLANLLGTWATVLDLGTEGIYLVGSVAERELNEDQLLWEWLSDLDGFTCHDAEVESAWGVEPGEPTGEPVDLERVKGLAREAVERELASR